MPGPRVLAGAAVADQDIAQERHVDDEPSWRWDRHKARAICACGSYSILEVLMKVENIDLDQAKIRAARSRDKTRCKPRRSLQLIDAKRLDARKLYGKTVIIAPRSNGFSPACPSSRSKPVVKKEVKYARI
jgi:hypothetical protein